VDIYYISWRLAGKNSRLRGRVKSSPSTHISTQ